MADQLLTGTTLIEDKRSERGNIWSCAGIKFKTRFPDVDNLQYSTGDGGMKSDTADLTAYASVELPNGVNVTSVEVFGNAAAGAGITWSLIKTDIVGGATTTMATASVNTADTTIIQSTIDNSSYSYFLKTGIAEFDQNDIINGAVIKYS